VAYIGVSFLDASALLDAVEAVSLSGAARMLAIDRRDLHNRLNSKNPPFKVYQLGPRMPLVHRSAVLQYAAKLNAKRLTGDRRVKQRSPR